MRASRRLTIGVLGLALSGVTLASLLGGDENPEVDQSDCPPAPASCEPDPTPSPDPGGDEDAEVTLPPSNGPMFGFNENHVVEGVAQEALQQLFTTAGANARRFPLDWRLVEPSRDEWDEVAWSSYRAAYDAIVADGGTPIVNFGFAPQWARERGEAADCSDFFACRYPPARKMDGEWEEFASEVARRLPKAVLEVWNEPNLAIFWRSGPDPDRFAELQTLAHDAIEEVDPSIVVIAGGFAANQEPQNPVAPATPGDVPMVQFLARAYEADPSIRDHMDGISFHPYPYGLDLGRGSVFAESFAEAREVTAENGDDDIGLWVTETGVASEGSFAVSEADQADLISRLVRRVSTMPDVEAVLIHRLFSPAGEGPGSTERGYALLRSNAEEPKPAFCELVELAGNEYPPCSN